MIIGLTGVYCAGKNYVASIFEARGLPVLDVDKLGYLALETEKERIFAQFGHDLRKADGTTDRRLLGSRVFKDPAKLAALEAIVHPAANRFTEEWAAGQKSHCLINAALLHRSSVYNKLDRVILVTAPFLTRLLRAKRRDKLPFDEILRRFSSQKNFNAQYLSIKAEIYRVENSGLFRGALERRIDEIIEGMG